MPCQGPFGYGYARGSDRADYLEAERRLCEARWLILRLTNDGAAVPTPFRALVAKHRAEQLKHRKGDKKHVIERIDATRARICDDMAEIVRRGGDVPKRLVDQERRLVAERARIKAITDEELLTHYWGNETRLTSDLVDHE